MLENRQQPFRVVSAEPPVNDIRSTEVRVLQSRPETRALRVITALYQASKQSGSVIPVGSPAGQHAPVTEEDNLRIHVGNQVASTSCRDRR